MTSSPPHVLEQGTSRLGLEPTREQLENIHNYLKLLQKWNARTNLTAARTERDLIELHILDSAAILPHLPPNSAHMIDVGSGAGFAAVVTAVFRPDLSVTAIEPAHKKHAFLSAVIRELPLPNLQANPTRLETHLEAETFRPYDLATSRATWPLLDWLQRARPLIHPQGTILGMEGATTHDLPPGATRHPYSLKNRTRAIILYTPPD